MVYAPHIRVTAIGRLGTSGEKFAYSLNMAQQVQTLPGVATGNADVWTDAAADVLAFHARPTSKIAPNAILEEVKFAMIGADGKYVEDARVVNVTDTMGGGAETNGAAYARAQTALAVSLVTGRRGPTGKGRFYLPCPTALHDDTFLISAAAAEGVRASAVTLINDLNNLPGLDSFPSFGVVVASSKG